MIPAVAPALSVAAGLAGAAVGAWSPALARVALAGGRRPDGLDARPLDPLPGLGRTAALVAAPVTGALAALVVRDAARADPRGAPPRDRGHGARARGPRRAPPARPRHRTRGRRRRVPRSGRGRIRPPAPGRGVRRGRRPRPRAPPGGHRRRPRHGRREARGRHRAGRSGRPGSRRSRWDSPRARSSAASRRPPCSSPAALGRRRPSRSARGSCWARSSWRPLPVRSRERADDPGRWLPVRRGPRASAGVRWRKCPRPRHRRTDEPEEKKMAQRSLTLLQDETGVLLAAASRAVL